MSNKKVLVVEDDGDVRLGLHILLTNNQYDTYLAADAGSALSEARKHKPDVVLLDLGLPGGDGFVVLERFKSYPYLAVIPVIVVSARDVHASKARALKAGARAFVQKPWNDTELLALTKQYAGQSAVALEDSAEVSDWRTQRPPLQW